MSSQSMEPQVRMSDPEVVVKSAVELCMQRGAESADARLVRTAEERLTVEDGRVREATAPEGLGIAIRVLKDGAVGFAAAPCDLAGLGDIVPGVARRALAVARDVAPLRRRPVRLSDEPASSGEYVTPCVENPFLVPLEEKIDLLMAASAAMEGRREIISRRASIGVRREEQWMATSQGGQTHQVLVRSGGGLEAMASARGVVERRSYPTGLGSGYEAGGFEVVRALDLPGAGERVRDEAISLCYADPCPGGVKTLILGGAQLALQIHESVGHPLELDRMLGEERDLAGGSFVRPADVGQLVYGSEAVSFVADSTVDGGLDTRGWDDDGSPSGRYDLVRNGKLVGAQSSRASAGALGAGVLGAGATTSSCRAEGWYAPPIDRITNVSLEPGRGSLDDLLASTEDGAIFADTVKSWSIDQERRNFQFTCEIAWEIRDGKRSRLLRLPTYQGSTLPFWRQCDAVAGPEEWRLFGVANCGKGNPMQIAEMSHGASPARFRKVQMLEVG